jgi:hypothetical protein
MMMSSPEIIVALLGLITTAGAVLSGAVAKLWGWVAKQIADCEADRIVLHGRIETLHDEIVLISKNVGRMEGHLEAIDQQRHKDHKRDT